MVAICNKKTKAFLCTLSVLLYKINAYNTKTLNILALHTKFLIVRVPSSIPIRPSVVKIANYCSFHRLLLICFARKDFRTAH